ncbi:MAG: hypothetical protein KA341_12750, partial [Saprospiraceae bacterium]|nr:hypothetical protein [Saprospiraceae bacterium]
ILQMKCNSILYGITCLLMFAGCKQDDQTLKSQIEGTWDVFASEMNNKPNSFMQDAWFTFSKDNNVNSNLFENQGDVKYEIHSGKLSIDIPDGFDMNIERLANDTLVLEGKLKFYYMEYFLVKRKDTQ